MGTLLISISYQKVKTKDTLNRQLFWYDFETENMNTLIGGELQFDYDFAAEKLKVSAKQVTYVAYKNQSNEKTVLSWIAENTEEYGLSLLEQQSGLWAVSFDDDKRSEVEDSLYNAHLDYEIT